MSVFNPGFGAPNASEGGGSTDLTAQASPGAVVVLSSTGIDAVIPGASPATAGVLTAADKVKLDSLSGELSLPDFETYDEASAATPTGNFLRTAGRSSAGDRGGALYVRVTSNPGHPGVLTVADGAFFDLATQRVTPVMFGAAGDGVADDGVALQAFFDYLETRPEILGDFSGKWLTRQPLTIRGGLGNRYICGEIIGDAPMVDLVTVIGQKQNFDGTFRLTGVASGSVADFSNRQIQNGINLDNAGRSVFDKIECQTFQRYGIRLESFGNNHINLGDVSGFDCGSPGDVFPSAVVTLIFTGRADNPELGFNQRSTLTTTGIPDFIKVSDIVVVGGRPLLVTGITGNDLEVYPRPPQGSTSGQIQCLMGGVISTFGNDAGLTWIESITSIRCAAALRVGSLYGPTVGKLHVDACAMGMVLGDTPLSSARRISIESAYFENTELHVIHTGSLLASVVIGNPLGLEFEKVIRLIFHDASDMPGQTEIPGTTIVGDAIYTRSAALGFGRPISVMTLANRPNQNQLSVRQNSIVIRLDYDEDLDRLYGLNTVELTLLGTGANNQPTGAITLEPTADEITRGVTVNGTTGFTLPSTEHPLWVLMRYDRAAMNWTVNFSEIAPSIPPSANIGNPSGGSVQDVQSRSAINAILTTLRDQGLLSS